MKNEKSKGIFIKGIVTGRVRKRDVGTKMAELVTYKIDTDNGALFVKDWSPTDYIELGESIDMPIRIGVYNGKYDLTFLSQNLQGESF